METKVRLVQRVSAVHEYIFSDEDYKKFSKLSKQERIDWMKEHTEDQEQYEPTDIFKIEVVK